MNYNINKSRKQSKTPVVTPRSLFKRGKKMQYNYYTKKSPHSKQELHKIIKEVQMNCNTARSPPKKIIPCVNKRPILNAENLGKLK